MSLVDKIAEHIIYSERERELLKKGLIKRETLGFATQKYLEKHPDIVAEINMHNAEYEELSSREIDWRAVRRNVFCEVGNYSMFIIMSPIAVAGMMGGGDYTRSKNYFFFLSHF